MHRKYRNIMEYLDLCRMREVGYTSTKLHFTNSWVHKPLKLLLCQFQVCNSLHSLFFCWWLSNSVALLRCPLLDWEWIAYIRLMHRTERSVLWRFGANTCTVPPLIHIHIYIHICTFTFTFMHLADAFIQSDLQCIQDIYFFYQYVCSLGIEPTTFCAANAMLYHWATETLYI